MIGLVLYRKRVSSGILVGAGFFAGFSVAADLEAQWRQWGGPNRDFVVESGKLATEWPESGPKMLWQRPLGDGYSAILFEGGRLYTMHRDGDNDKVVSLDASTGETLWETSYHSPTLDDMILDFGPGPISTPLLVGDRLYTLSSTVKFHCLDAKTGDIIWAHDLMKEMGARHLGRGYGPSPVAFGDTVIVNVGGDGEGQAIVAFDQKSGDVVWKSQSFRAGYSSPILVNIDGHDQLIVAMGTDRAGLDPASGELQWHLKLPNTASTTMSTMHFGADHLLFGSSAYADGSRVIRIAQHEGKFEAEELWYSRKMRVMYSSFLRIGDYVYGSSGDFGPAFLIAMNIKDGKVAWRKRGFSRAHLMQADGKVVVLDEDGNLTIATASPDDLQVHAQANIIERLAWTPPTLVGTQLFVRNRTEIKAFDLGPQ